MDICINVEKVTEETAGREGTVRGRAVLVNSGAAGEKREEQHSHQRGTYRNLDKKIEEEEKSRQRN